MQPYTHIIFDLDHTLWDWNRCSAETLTDIFQHYDLEKMGIEADAFIAEYVVSIHELWHALGRGELSKEALREKRFPYVFQKMGVAVPDCVKEIEKAYVYTCPRKPHLIPHTVSTLEHLQDKGYTLQLLTNGFADATKLKIDASGIRSYFQNIVCASDVGHHKPSPIIFQHIFQLIKATSKDCLMVGDNLRADIQGANNVDMHSIYFAPKAPPNNTATHQVKCLSQLQEIL